MIVEESTPDVGSADCSPKSSIAEPYTPSQFDAACIEQSPVAYGSLQSFDSFSLSHLYRYSTFNFNPEDHMNDVLRGPTHPLEEEDLVPTSPVSWTAAVEDSDIDLGQGMTAMPTGEDDDAPVRMSIKSLDIGEEPVFDLPSGWREAFVSPVDVTLPRSSQVEGTKKRLVLPTLKSLRKQAASKFVSRWVCQ
jgi:hypothetical protein